jgi:hypothetical protein
MTDRFTPVMRALVAATLLVATATLMLVAVNTARAAGALAIGACGAFGEAYDFSTAAEARKSALAKCQNDTYWVVPTPSTAAPSLRSISLIPVARMAGARGHGSGAARTRPCAPATKTAARNVLSAPTSATPKAEPGGPLQAFHFRNASRICARGLTA